jgi:hypothetical protein
LPILHLCPRIRTLHPLEIGARLELLYGIEPDQVDQIQTHRDEGDQDVVKTRVQEGEEVLGDRFWAIGGKVGKVIRLR